MVAKISFALPPKKLTSLGRQMLTTRIKPKLLMAETGSLGLESELLWFDL